MRRALLLVVLGCWGSLVALGWREGSVPFATIAQGTSSGITTATRAVIRDQGAWARLWSEHTARLMPVPPVPPVDFSREMVVGVFAGEQRTGGFEIEIIRIEQGSEGIAVQYRERAPSPGDLVPQALTQPYHLVRLRRLEGTVAFQAVR
ncbi:MAG: protease complex subunit PrcB family protein [Deltaproteobacteria bacterium]|nr:protease complex subunit PrcB family protein [Deltaproteobacteria bacterium]MBI3075408.1 protease complex subunit PrcB family protein [Deltaproteobacteria bacterium]